MTSIDFTRGDDLSDLLGGSAPVQAAPRQLPQDDQLARIRDRGIGEQPVAKAFRVNCSKCGGRGRFISYSGRDCGPCYTCQGKGFKETKTSPTKLAANREKAAERKANREVQNLDAFKRDFPGHWAWIERTAAQAVTERNRGFMEIVQSIPGKIMQYGDLHSGLMAMVERGMARDQERAAQRAQETVQQQQRVAGVNVANLVDVFQRANTAGLKRFSLRFVDLHMAMDRKDHDKVWVSQSGYGSARYGLLKISEGRFYPGRDFTDEVRARLELVSADPMAAAKAYTQVTSSCSVCGLHLENQDSVDAGMGPICAGRINRPGLKFVEVKAGEDF